MSFGVISFATFNGNCLVRFFNILFFVARGISMDDTAVEARTGVGDLPYLSLTAASL